MTEPRIVVAVVDDDESVRESVPGLLRTLGYEAIAYASAEEFLTSHSAPKPQCLILDIAMPGMSGPQLQQELADRGLGIPVIFITARASESIRSGLKRNGAVECLLKPFTTQQLLGALDAALARG